MGVSMISELDDDWKPEITTGLVEHDTPELGSSANKMLHVVYRVGNMDRTIKFYQDVFGMKVRTTVHTVPHKHSARFALECFGSCVLLQLILAFV